MAAKYPTIGLENAGGFDRKLPPRLVEKALRECPSMIKSFKCRETKKVFRREHTRKLPPGIQRQAQKKLYLLDAAMSLDDLRIARGRDSKRLRETGKADTASGLTRSEGFVTRGETMPPTTRK